MSRRGFDFVVEMFPNMDKTVLSEIFSNIENDDEVDRVVASLLDGVDEMPFSDDREVPQVAGKVQFLPHDNVPQADVVKQADPSWTRLPVESTSLPQTSCCTAGKCFEVGHPGAEPHVTYPQPPSVAQAHCPPYWPATQPPQQVNCFVQPNFTPISRHHVSMPYTNQAAAVPPYLQSFCTPPLHQWPPSTSYDVPFSLPVYNIQATENHVPRWSAPAVYHRPDPLDGNDTHSWSGFAGYTGDTYKKQSSCPEKNSQHTSADMSMTSRSLEVVPRVENDILECADRCENVVSQETVASSRASETVIASHYMSLVTILPNSDPAFIRRKCEEINGSVGKLQKFLVEALTLGNYDKNFSVSVVEEKLTRKNAAEVIEGVPRSLDVTGGHQGSSGVHVSGDEICVPSTSSCEDNATESDLNEEVTAASSALVNGHPTETGAASQLVAVVVSNASSDNLCNFEVLESVDVGDREDSVDAPCAVSSESEFELNVVKLDDVSVENESCLLLEVDAQELGTCSSGSTVPVVAAAPTTVPEAVPSCGEGSSPQCPEISIVDISSGSEDLPIDVASGYFAEVADNLDVNNDFSVCSIEDDANESGEILVENVMSRDYVGGHTFAGLSEDNSNHFQQSQLLDESWLSESVPKQMHDYLPPEVIAVDPNFFVDTTNDYEIARMISEQDEARALCSDPLEEMMSMLLNFMPDADPSYLKDIVERFCEDKDALLAFVQECLDSKYPTFDDYLERQGILGLIRESLSQITISMFVKLYNRPIVYFYGSRQKEQSEVAHELGFLQRRYRNVSDGSLRAVLDKCNHNLTLSCKELDVWHGPTQHVRGDWECETPRDIDVCFVYEVFFIENEREIREYLELECCHQAILNRAKFMEAKLECPICYDDELEIVQMAACIEGHLFCKECVTKNAETRIGDGLTKFPCLDVSCSAEFGTRTLESLLNATLFARMVQQRSLEEVESAHLEDLVRCPFCEYAAILPPDLSVLVCESPECMKETCRYCKESNHIPLHCHEVEKEGETKMRTEIEDKMTDALLRQCNSCGKKFIKSDGCNKMVCPCGAIMCYLCRKTVKDYTHFNGMGGTEFYKCALFTNDSVIHHEEVKRAAARAKAEVTARNPGLELKSDPTVLLPDV